MYVANGRSARYTLGLLLIMLIITVAIIAVQPMLNSIILFRDVSFCMSMEGSPSNYGLSGMLLLMMKFI
jgi:hypothetical protein